jgi:hypothetical protein
MRPARFRLETPARGEDSVLGLPTAESGKSMPGISTAARAERVLGLGRFTRQQGDVLLTAERAIRKQLRIGARALVDTPPDRTGPLSPRFDA